MFWDKDLPSLDTRGPNMFQHHNAAVNKVSPKDKVEV